MIKVDFNNGYEVDTVGDTELIAAEAMQVLLKIDSMVLKETHKQLNMLELVDFCMKSYSDVIHRLTSGDDNV